MDPINCLGIINLPEQISLVVKKVLQGYVDKEDDYCYCFGVKQ